MKKLGKILMVAFIGATMASCAVNSKVMTEPNYRLDFDKNDFEYSAIVKGEATSTLILGIDWSRLFDRKGGSTASDLPTGSVSLPIIGSLTANVVESYALYDLMRSNPNYDVILFPMLSQENSGIPFLYWKRKATVSARLGKLKN